MEKSKEMEQGISVVIPAYNEALRLPNTLRKIHNHLTKQGQTFEITVIDDGSTDDTSNIITLEARTRDNIKLLKNPTNKGKGYANKLGVQHAKFGLILLTDADLSAPIENLEKMITEINTGTDIVTGSRSLPNSRIGIKQPPHRRLMGATFRFLTAHLLLPGFTDTQCGFKLLTSTAAKDIFGRITTDGYAYDIEMLLIAGKLGYKTKEVPISWSDSPHSKIRPVKDSVAMLADILRIRKKYRHKHPPDQGRKPRTGDHNHHIKVI